VDCASSKLLWYEQNAIRWRPPRFLEHDDTYAALTLDPRAHRRLLFAHPLADGRAVGGQAERLADVDVTTVKSAEALRRAVAASRHTSYRGFRLIREGVWKVPAEAMEEVQEETEAAAEEEDDEVVEEVEEDKEDEGGEGGKEDPLVYHVVLDADDGALCSLRGEREVEEAARDSAKERGRQREGGGDGGSGGESALLALALSLLRRSRLFCYAEGRSIVTGDAAPCCTAHSLRSGWTSDDDPRGAGFFPCAWGLRPPADLAEGRCMHAHTYIYMHACMRMGRSSTG